MRIGVLGGTFDPIHLGHLIIAEEARGQLGLHQVIFMPAGEPWLKAGQPSASSEHRYRMVELAVAGNPYFRAARNEIDRPGPTYTVDTLGELRQALGEEAELYFILGADALAQFHRWKEPERVLGSCTLVVVNRPPYDGQGLVATLPGAAGKVVMLSAPLMGIESSDIRQRAARRLSLRYLVPEAVAQYIGRHGLYGAGPGARGAPEQAGAGDAGRARPYDGAAQRLLQLALERGALKYGSFTLSSGRKSSYYFDGRLLSLEPEGAHLIGRCLTPILQQAGAQAVGGPTLGADPIVAAVALTSYLEGAPIPAFIVRKEAKGHGTQQAIEGPLAPRSRVAIVDDVCTTGGSLFHAIAAAEAAGCVVVKVVALLDRREGGSQELSRRGYDFQALLAVTPAGAVEVLSPA